MAYRDDLEAANARIAQLEGELEEARDAQLAARDDAVKILEERLEKSQKAHGDTQNLAEDYSQQIDDLRTKLRDARSGYIKFGHAILLILVLCLISFAVALAVHDPLVRLWSNGSASPRGPRVIRVNFGESFGGDVRAINLEEGPFWEFHNNSSNAVLRIEANRSTKGHGTIKLYRRGESEPFWHVMDEYEELGSTSNYVNLDDGWYRIVLTGEGPGRDNNDGVFTMTIMRYVLNN